MFPSRVMRTVRTATVAVLLVVACAAWATDPASAGCIGDELRTAARSSVTADGASLRANGTPGLSVHCADGRDPAEAVNAAGLPSPADGSRSWGPVLLAIVVARVVFLIGYTLWRHSR